MRSLEGRQGARERRRRIILRERPIRSQLVRTFEIAPMLKLMAGRHSA
jgi:hypothetical protein